MPTPQTRVTDAEASPEPLKEIRLKPDAFARMAASNRQYAKGINGDGGPNLAAVARQGGMSKANLAKFVNGDQPLTLNVVHLVIAVSGMDWLDALAEYFDYGVPDCDASAGQREMAVAA
jgi:hypothetical protein